MVKRYQFQADLIKFFTEEHVAAVLDITREPGENGVIQRAGRRNLRKRQDD